MGVAAVWGKLVTSSASKAGGQFVGVKSHKKKSEPIQQLLPVSQREMGDSVVPVVGRGPWWARESRGIYRVGEPEQVM